MSKINRRQNFATQLVKAPRDQYKVLFETTPVALVEGVWSSTFKVFHHNNAAMELFSAASADQFQKGFNNLLLKMDKKTYLDVLSARVKGDMFEAELRLPTFRRGHVFVFMRLVYMPAPHSQGPQHAILAFHDITAYKKRENFFLRMAQVDGLTQVYNHSAIIRRLEEELIRAKRYELDLSCVLFDVDNFKQINDEHGHLNGDKALKCVAQVLKRTFRQTDIVGRYGGDEFLVILPETSFTQATIPVGRFLKDFESEGDLTYNQKAAHISLSVGISGFPGGHGDTASALIESADKALYTSKTSGGNCYHICSQKD